MLAIHLDIGDVVLEDGGDVDLFTNRISILCLFSWRWFEFVVWCGDGLIGGEGSVGGVSGRARTSGKVPLEKTLRGN